MMRRNPNRGVVLGLADAAAIRRMLEFWMDGRRFDNPIVACEVKQGAKDAKARLAAKLCAIYEAHQSREESQVGEGAP